MSKTKPEYEFKAEEGAITCPGCRVCVPWGRTCPCPMRTTGPLAEPVLPRLGRRRAVS